MATIRVHEDQENRIADIFRGKENIVVPAQNQVLQQTKRAVLGVLHNNCHRIVKTVCILFVPIFFRPFPFHPYSRHYNRNISIDLINKIM